MSEHAWTQDNLAAHVAGGLDAGERERLDRHLAECLDCTSALENARAADRRLLSLFKDVQPGPALEDRLIRSLRQGAARKRVMPGMSGPWVKVVLATAAVALIAVVGAGISRVIDNDGVLAMAASEEEERQSSDTVPMAKAEPRVYYSPYGGIIGGKKPHVGMMGGGGGGGFGGGGFGGGGFGGGTVNGRMPSSEELAQQLRADSPFALVDGRANGQPSATTKAEKTKEMKVLLDTSASMGVVDGVKAHRDVKASVPTQAPKTPTDDSPNSFQAPLLGNNYSVTPNSPYLNMAPPPPAPATSAAPKAAESLNTNMVANPGNFNNSPGTTSGASSSNTTGPTHTFDDNKQNKQQERRNGLVLEGKDLKELAAEKKLPVLGYYYRPDSTFTDLDRESKLADDKSKNSGDAFKIGAGANTDNGLVGSITLNQTKAITDLSQGKQDPKQPPAKTAPPAQPKAHEAPDPVMQKVIIRSGDIEFVIDSFDNGVLIIQKLIAATKGGYVGTINSDKLPNGKVYGSVVVRVPPEQLDKLVLDLRQQLGKIGELKGQRIGSRDITKEFTDLQSRLKAARTMEERLLNIIKSEKGQIKDLLMAEKELGVWRTKIEELTGELNYYANMASLSTLTITMSEKELRVAASVSESERVQAGVEVEDVEKAMRALLKAVDEAKGRVTRSELKQQSAGQYNALLQFEVAPEGAGPVRDLLKQLGNVTRLDIDRVQEAENGDKLPMDGKLHRGNTKFFVSLYNLFSIAPRETVSVRIYVPDVAVAYRELRTKVIDAKGRILDANLSEQDRQSVIAHMDFDIKRVDEPAIETALAAAGERLGRQVARAQAGANVTDTKVLYRVDLVANVPARETVTMRLAAADVAADYAALRAAVAAAKGRIINTNFNEQDRTNVGAQIDFDVKRSEQAAIQTALASAGEVLSRTVVRAAEGDNVTDTKVAFRITLAGNIQPRETVTVTIAATDVAAAHRTLRTVLAQAKARILSANLDEKDRQNVDGQLDFDVRRTEEGVVQTALTEAGAVLSRFVSRITTGENYTDARVLFKVKLVPASSIEPREVRVLAVEVSDVEQAVAVLTAQVKEVQGRVVKGPTTGQERSGRVTARVSYDVPLVMAGTIVDKLKGAGTVRISDEASNPQAPEGKLAIARIDVSFSTGEVLVPRDDGLTLQVRSGLSSSLQGLFWSVKFLIIGLLFVLPWLLVIYAMVRLGRRLWRPAVLAPAEAPAAPQ